ncbi:hypothetical protein CXG81DRAFT_26040 [Caulochytrium protostelioides]|uniref:Mediator of DNA damage checkpoint protein 1 n=1 Tax=Caulochytrium protostelioides TaxID=1555241 RepID=A0A4V1IUP5_9FUNG|nr:hypothetical protein CXG81DRAFT_26040 [Caulochytrium protostelioides]|eukprot:RKP01279.1 hypothetical protein CXG81DRAFT_26040 [Caulochytrium protostelioides]
MDARGPETEEDKLKEAVVGYLEECFSNDLPEDQKIVIGHLRYLCDDPNQRIVIPIKTGYTAIGSAPILPERLNSDIQIAMRGVSARHALLEVSPDGTERFIEDLFSTNFTCFGPTEYRLAPRRCYELTDGKIILFGPVRFEFTLVDEVRLAIQRADAAARGTLGPSPMGSSLHATSQALDLSAKLARSRETGSPHASAPSPASAGPHAAPRRPRGTQLADSDPSSDDGAAADASKAVRPPPPPPPRSDVAADADDASTASGPSVSPRDAASETLATPKDAAGVRLPPRSPAARVTYKKHASARAAGGASLKRGRASAAPSNGASAASDPHSLDHDGDRDAGVKREKRTAADGAAAPEPPADVSGSSGTRSDSRSDARSEADASPTAVSPRAEDRVAIAYTGITETDALREIREALGGELVDDWREATHLVTDRVRRTVKFLAALLAGKHIVGPRYVEACAREGRWCPVQAKHLVKDAKMQREYGFTLCKSIKAAAARPLFQGLTFYVTPHVTPPGATLGEMINAGQGKTVSAIGPDVPGANIIVIGCPEDAAECDALRQRGFRIVDREFILTGSLRQELNYTGHALSP